MRLCAHSFLLTSPRQVLFPTFSALRMLPNANSGLKLEPIREALRRAVAHLNDGRIVIEISGMSPLE